MTTKTPIMKIIAMVRIITTTLLLGGFTVNAAVTQLNVLSFGARQNISTFDNRTALSNSVLAAKSLGVGTIYAPAAIYWTRGPIPGVDANVTLVGDASINSSDTNPGTVIKLATGANASLVRTDTGLRINLKGLVFDGNKANQTVAAPGVWFKSLSSTIDRSSMEDCIVKNVKGIGVHNDAREARFYNDKVEGSESHGWYNTASSDVTFREILAGFNGGYGCVFYGANSARMTTFDFYRNGMGGMLLSNANNNLFVGGKTDANVQDGLLLAAANGVFAYRNEFIGVDFVKNNFYLDENGQPTDEPTGTYSNVKLLGDLAVDNVFIACRFWEAQDPSELGVVPKYLFEDARPYYLTNNFIGSRTILNSCHFTTDSNYWDVSYAQSNIVQYAILDSFLDGSRWFTDNIYYRDLLAIKLHVTDQLESLNGMQVNSFFNSAWYYRQTGPAYQIRARQDNPIFGIQWAPSGTASNALTWTTSFNLNSTNGYIGINQADTAAVTPFEVLGTSKATLFEGESSAYNAYFSAGAWHYRAPGYAYLVQAQPTFGSYVIFTAPTGVADAVITFVASISIDSTGNVSIPVSLTVPSLTISNLYTQTITSTNGLTVLQGTTAPTAAAVGAGAGRLWASNSVPPTIYWTSTTDGASATTYKVAGP